MEWNMHVILRKSIVNPQTKRGVCQNLRRYWKMDSWVRDCHIRGNLTCPVNTNHTGDSPCPWVLITYLSILPEQEKITITTKSLPWSTTPIRTCCHHLPNAQTKETISQLCSSRGPATRRRNQDKTSVETTEDDCKIQQLALKNCVSGCVQQANVLTGVGYPKQMSYFVYFYRKIMERRKKCLRRLTGEPSKSEEYFGYSCRSLWQPWEIPGMLSPTALAHNKA